MPVTPLRPISNVSLGWVSPSYLNIDDIAVEPDTPPLTTYAFTDYTGNGNELKIGMATLQEITGGSKISIWVFSKSDPNNELLQIFLRLNGVLEGTDSHVISPTGTWYNSVFTGTFTVAQMDNIVIGLRADNLQEEEKKDDEEIVFVGVLYADATYTTTRVGKGKYLLGLY